MNGWLIFLIVLVSCAAVAGLVVAVLAYQSNDSTEQDIKDLQEQVDDSAITTNSGLTGFVQGGNGALSIVDGTEAQTLQVKNGVWQSVTETANLTWKSDEATEIKIDSATIIPMFEIGASTYRPPFSNTSASSVIIYPGSNVVPSSFQITEVDVCYKLTVSFQLSNVPLDDWSIGIYVLETANLTEQHPDIARIPINNIDASNVIAINGWEFDTHSISTTFINTADISKSYTVCWDGTSIQSTLVLGNCAITVERFK